MSVGASTVSQRVAPDISRQPRPHRVHHTRTHTRSPSTGVHQPTRAVLDRQAGAVDPDPVRDNSSGTAKTS